MDRRERRAKFERPLSLWQWVGIVLAWAMAITMVPLSFAWFVFWSVITMERRFLPWREHWQINCDVLREGVRAAMVKSPNVTAREMERMLSYLPGAGVKRGDQP